MLFLNIYNGLGYFIRTTHINWIHKVWAYVISKRQQETNGLLGKKRLSWNKPIMGTMSVFRKLQLLESDSVTWLVLLCSLTILLDCGYIVLV